MDSLSLSPIRPFDPDNTAKKCEFWLRKGSRHCLTAPLEGLRFCEIHANLVAKNPEAYVENTVDRIEEKNDSRVTCRFWLERKKRFCKVLPKEGLLYCVEHSNMQVEPERTRITCKYDPRHSCYVDQLESHLKKCNSRPSLKPEYFEEGINARIKFDDSEETPKIVLQDVDMSELNEVICKISIIHAEYASQTVIRKDMRNHEIFKTSFEASTNGSSALKHLKQQASLVGHLEDMDLLNAKTTYIEFGAGRGGLSHWVQLANARNDCKFLLVDKSSVRYKKDSYHKGPDQGPGFERLKIDIQDLVLDKVPSCYDSDNDIVGIGKHLCGNATDFMLRCMSNSKMCLKLKGIVLATCCHHRCEWNSYVGHEWFSKQNLNSRFFQFLTKLSAWATCGSRDANDEHINSANYNHAKYGNLRPEEREEIGFLAKNIIDFGRIEFLKENNFQVELIEYVTKAVTLESHAIIAKKA